MVNDNNNTHNCHGAHVRSIPPRSTILPEKYHLIVFISVFSVAIILARTLLRTENVHSHRVCVSPWQATFGLSSGILARVWQRSSSRRTVHRAEHLSFTFV